MIILKYLLALSLALNGIQFYFNKSETYKAEIIALQAQLDAKESERVEALDALQLATSELEAQQQDEALLLSSISALQEEVEWARNHTAKRERQIAQLRSQNANLDRILSERIPSALVH